MPEAYFHCSNSQGAPVNRCGAIVADLSELNDYAELVVRSLIMAPALEDWRGWVLHVSDDLGEEIFTVRFASLLGKPN